MMGLGVKGCEMGCQGAPEADAEPQDALRVGRYEPHRLVALIQ